MAVILVAAYSFAVTFILLKILGAITNIRPSDEIIQEGLDQTLLNETTYDID